MCPEGMPVITMKNIDSATSRNSVTWLCSLCLSLGLSLGLYSPTASSESLKDCNVALYEQVRDSVLDPLFNALQAGDIAAIRTYLSDSLGAEYQALFDRNQGYGEFLRGYYQGSGYEVMDIVGSGNEFLAVVMIFWPDGNTIEVELDLDPAKGEIVTDLGPDACSQSLQ